MELSNLSKKTLSLNPTMSKRTVTNENYHGLIENISIPVELSERDGKIIASAQNAHVIHACTPEQVETLSQTTHHYCDIFTDSLLAPLEELVYVRVDGDKAEKVFINRTKRLLITSSDGRLAIWRAAPTFESRNNFVVGAPIVRADGQLVSLVTAKRGHHYAVSTLEGSGGYIESPRAWLRVAGGGGARYGSRSFVSRDAAREHVRALPPAAVGPAEPVTPVLHEGDPPRIAIVASNGRQLSHQYLHAVLADDIQYL